MDVSGLQRRRTGKGLQCDRPENTNTMALAIYVSHKKRMSTLVYLYIIISPFQRPRQFKKKTTQTVHRGSCVCLSVRSDYQCFQIELAKNYGQTEWREDIKGIMLKAGLKNKQITFLFVDTQVRIEENQHNKHFTLAE